MYLAAEANTIKGTTWCYLNNTRNWFSLWRCWKTKDTCHPRRSLGASSIRRMPPETADIDRRLYSESVMSNISRREQKTTIRSRCPWLLTPPSNVSATSPAPAAAHLSGSRIQLSGYSKMRPCSRGQTTNTWGPSQGCVYVCMHLRPS